MLVALAKKALSEVAQGHWLIPMVVLTIMIFGKVSPELMALV